MQAMGEKLVQGVCVGGGVGVMRGREVLMRCPSVELPLVPSTFHVQGC